MHFLISPFLSQKELKPHANAHREWKKKYDWTTLQESKKSKSQNVQHSRNATVKTSWTHVDTKWNKKKHHVENVLK